MEPVPTTVPIGGAISFSAREQSRPATLRPAFQSAFTLLELLLAILIFAIVLSAIHGVFFTALRLRDRTSNAIERSLPHLERACGLRWSCLRYFNAAGADPDGELGEDHRPEIHLIPRAIEAAAGGPPLEVFGDDYPTPDGTCLRDYVHVSDLADGHVLALQAVAETGRSGVYNLGTGRPHSVLEVIDAVERVSGGAVPRTVVPRRPGDPAVLYASAQKASSELKWQPQFTSLDAIVRTAWNWYQAHPQGYRATAQS